MKHTYNALLYLPDNVLMYLALIRPILGLLPSQIEIKYVKK